MNKNKFNYKLINLTTLMILLYITISNIGTWFGIISEVIKVMLPFIIAFALSYALTPLVWKMEKQKIPRWVAVLIISASLVIIVILLLMLTLPLIYDELVLLSTNLTDIIDTISNKLNLNLGSFEIKLDDAINSLISELGGVVTKSTSNFISASIGVIGNLIIGFVATVYFLSYMDNIRKAVKIFLKKISERSYKYVKVLDTELGNYVKGLVIFMVIQFFEYSLLFKIVNHPNWLIIGLLACLTTVIPYFGGLITNIIALALASVTNAYTFIGSLIICLIFPQLDGYLISPKVYGKTNNVNPLITIMAVSVGGTIAGMWGIIASLPVYLFIRATYNFFKKDLVKNINTIKKSI